MCDRALAAEFVKAPSFPVTFITEGMRETAGVEVGATGAVLVDHAIVGELWASVLVERRQFTHGHVLKHHRKEVVRIGRASRKIDDGLSGNDGVDANGTGGVRVG
jgi:hypothetical protein